MKVAASTCFLLLAGCSLTGPAPNLPATPIPPTTEELLKAGLSALVGQDIHAAISRLGYPETQRTIPGDAVYRWIATNEYDLTAPRASTTSGYTAFGDPFFASSTTEETQHVSLRCTLDIATNADGKIAHYQWAGDVSTCGKYAEALRQ